MQGIGIGFDGDYGIHLQNRSARISALALLLVVAAITTSCGTAAQAASGSSGNALALTGNLPNGTVSQSYNAVLAVGGGATPYQFTIASGVLPPGLVLNPATGSFTGTPSTAGSYTFEVMVTDRPKPDQGTQTFILSVGKGNGGGGAVKVSLSPTSVTLSSGGTQQFTATVTGTSDTAVIWSTSDGSISGGGLYTAPKVTSATNVTITATSEASPSQSASAGVTIDPGQGQGQPLQVTTSGLPQGQQGENYSAVFSASGGTQPYSWTITQGAIPQGITLSQNGDFVGTPTATGTSSFTTMVTDSTGKTATANLSVNVVAGSGYDGPAQLPLVTVSTAMSDSPTPGAVTNVAANGNLQSALSNAHCGDTIQLQAGATFTGMFTLPAKNCDVNNWIIIRTSSPDSSLPAQGTRTTPCYAGVASLEGRPAYSCPNPKNVLAKVEMQSTGNGPFQLANGANFYRFVGLEITRANGIKGSGSLISNNGTADHIIVDRSWLHGNTQDETSDGYAMAGGTYVGVVDSYFSDFHCIANTGACTDAHAVSGGVGNNQDGPYLIQDNFLEASGEAVFFGGGAATTTPTDIEIIGNHFWKPWQWMKGNTPFVGGQDGNPFVVKNHMELKNAVRVLVEANLMENSWGGFSQVGYGILLTPKNQHTQGQGNVCSICEVTDVTVRYTHIAHAGGGIQMVTGLSGNGQGGAPAKAGTRWSIHDVVMDDISTNYVGPGMLFEVANGWPKNPLNTILINHITGFPDTKGGLMFVGNQDSNPQMSAFGFTNSIVVTGSNPVWNMGGGNTNCGYYDVPLKSLSACFSTYTFNYNAILASPAHYPPSSWPTGNFFAAGANDAGFTQYNNGNGGNYQLLPSSPYVNAGSDGLNLGADIAGLNAALANVE